MTLVVRHVSLRASTERGLYGADLPLTRGLNVIRADNSRGKSTAVRGLVYALALERMITTRVRQALPSAMRESLIYDAESKAETPVLTSWVEAVLEFESETISVRRSVSGGDLKPDLIRVWAGNVREAGGYPDQHRDYYVGSGNTTSGSGFHPYLAQLLGWDLPTVEWSGGTSRLYLEQVFPLLLVEQIRGWAGIQAQTPAFSGMPDVRRRALEFLAALDAGKNESERRELRRKEAELNADWHQEIRTFEGLIEAYGLVLDGVPTSLSDVWPPSPPAALRAPVGPEQWADASQVLKELRGELAQLRKPVDIPSSSDDEEALQHALGELEMWRETGASLRERIVSDRRELTMLGQRRGALLKDKREHADLVKLQSLGSDALAPLHSDCPACHRPLEGLALAAGDVGGVLSPAGTLAYLDQQVELVDAMISDGNRSLNASTERLAAVDRNATDARRRVRALKADLVSGAAPGRAAVLREVQLESQAESLATHLTRFEDLEEQLEALAARAAEVRSAIKNLPAGRGLSEIDKTKLEGLQRAFLRQLSSYGFGSFAEGRLSISSSDYLPKREEFDLQADISASDAIRVIWAYLLGLFELSESHETRHPRWLLFDEPRQQSAEEVSFHQLLREAATATAVSGQVIFVTSEGSESLKSMISDVPCTLLDIDGYLLRPLATS